MSHDNGSESTLNVIGARVNNLRNIDVSIPHGSLTVITGLSGSGKSSLAFDTIYAEGQRRYIETFSSYARNMLGSLERPDVDQITGLSPVIAIEQKTVNRNPRSTIGTTTEVYDFLRLLFARAGHARSYISGSEMVRYTDEQIVDLILSKYAGKRIYVLAPLVKNRKGHYKELFETLRKKGFIRVRVDGAITEITPEMKLDRYRNHSVELVVDRLAVSANDRQRLYDTVAAALEQGDKEVMIYQVDTEQVSHYSMHLMDPDSGLSYREPAPHNFSFNSPQGYCPRCKGLGYVNIIDREKIIPDAKLSIHDGAFQPLGKYRNSTIFNQLLAICQNYGCDLHTPLCQIPDEAVDEMLNGSDRPLTLTNRQVGTITPLGEYEGLIKYIEMQQDDDAGAAARRWSTQFYTTKICPECHGQRLCRESLNFYVDNLNIAQLAAMDISTLRQWAATVMDRLDNRDRQIAAEIIKEISSRLHFLCEIGLGYLQLTRRSATLSGGESQRIDRR